MPGDAAEWLASRFAGREDVAIAVEACTGWRYVVEELLAAGVEPHLADPAETAARRGKNRRAKSDRADCRHMRELLVTERLPECWIGPPIVLELQTQMRPISQRLTRAARFTVSRKAVRFTGLDITVYASAEHRSPGQLSRQGPPVLRWLLYEAGRCAPRPGSPDGLPHHRRQTHRQRQGRRPDGGP